jgi:CheY-like chemotaxis protein
VLHDTVPLTRQTRTSPPKRILVVDDDAISMEVLALMLGCDGHKVMRAADAKTALDLMAASVASALPEVVLVDIQLPGISGYELADKLRALEGSTPRMLAMSATAVNTQELRGFDGFLLKPLAIDDLRQALRPSPETSTGRTYPLRRRPGKRSAPARKPEKLIDEAVLNKLAKAMPPESLRELYRACIDDSRQRLGALKELALAGRIREIPRGAHQIKGAASMIGAARLARLAASLELGSCKEEDTLRLLNELLDACNELERMLLAGKFPRVNSE